MLLSLPCYAQVSFNVKPPVSLWDYSTDIASIEIRLRGRLSTDSATTHKIIGRIKLAKWDLSLLTARATILVPATQTWEVKSLSVFIVPAVATGLASVEVILKNLPTSYTAPAGQQIAIDIGSKTGVGVIGPVSLAPPPPPPPPVSTMASSIADGAVLTGSVVWTVVPSRTPDRVEFAVNNVKSPAVEFTPPYRFNGDTGFLVTTTIPNGAAVLRATAFFSDGTSDSRTIYVTVAN